jgi:hypothetical protein
LGEIAGRQAYKRENVFSPGKQITAPAEL